MPVIKPISHSGYKSIIQNIELYTKEFIQEGILLFKNVYLSLEEQRKIQYLFGTRLNCFPNERNPFTDSYIEDHASNPKTITSSPESIILDWHIEHEYYENHLVIGFWNMEVFNTQPERGNTLFVDLTKLYLNLSLDEQDFLRQCTIIHPQHLIDDSDYLAIKDKIQKDITSSVIKEHWFTKEPVLRLSFWEHNSLYQFNNQEPTEEQVIYYNNLIKKIHTTVKEDKEIRKVQQWSQGDLLIVDLEKMAHAVCGGFEPENRKFIGMWSTKYNKDLYPNLDYTSLL